MATVGAEGPFPPALCLFCSVQNPEGTRLQAGQGVCVHTEGVSDF